MKKLNMIFLVLVLALSTFQFLRFQWGVGIELNTNHILEAPGNSFYFGTDSLGRDFLSRVFLGGFYSLSVAMLAASLAIFLSLFFAVVSEFFLKKFEVLFLRSLDVFQSIPSFILVALICLFLPFQNVYSLSLCIALVSWMTPFRLLRGYVRQTLLEDFVTASRVLGATRWHVMRTHLWLYLKGPVKNLWLTLIPQAILYESSLSFIGFGIQSPATSWGLLVQEGWRTMAQFPYLVFFPSLLMAFTCLSLNYVVGYKN